MLVENTKNDYIAVDGVEEVCEHWRKARMRALSSLPYEDLNHILHKIDKRFKKFLNELANSQGLKIESFFRY